ncbi:MAG TPA: STAS domain-containing protein [Candidatus Acidoferrum sp.]|jgi:anti-sigma B factor antagonist
MRIKTKSEGGAIVVAIRDSHLGADTVVEFKRQMTDQLPADAHTVLLEMREVPFVDSTGLGALVAIRRRLGETGVLAICGSQPSVLELFQLARLDKIFQFYPDTEAALSRLVAETVHR